MQDTGFISGLEGGQLAQGPMSPCHHLVLLICGGHNFFAGNHGLFVSKRNFMTNKLADHLQCSSLYAVEPHGPTHLSTPLLSGTQLLYQQQALACYSG